MTIKLPADKVPEIADAARVVADITTTPGSSDHRAPDRVDAACARRGHLLPRSMKMIVDSVPSAATASA